MRYYAVADLRPVADDNFVLGSYPFRWLAELRVARVDQSVFHAAVLTRKEWNELRGMDMSLFEFTE